MAEADDLMAVAEELSRLAARLRFLEAEGVAMQVDVLSALVVGRAREARPAARPATGEELAEGMGE